MKRLIRCFFYLATIATVASFGFTAATTAQEIMPPKLHFPLACTIGEDCWIARFVNRAENNGRADFMCGRRSQEGHKGTDFVINDYGQMQKGVSVRAVLAGTVLRRREGVPDKIVTKENAKETRKTGCGNALVLKHANGYQTAYCHMKKGSLTVEVGDKVTAGQVIGQVGLSGFTEYPHLHFDLRKDGQLLDPFDGKPSSTSCSKTNIEGLWEDPLPYKDMVLMPLTFSTEKPTRQSRWQQTRKSISSDAPAIILTARSWNTLKGDRWLFQIFRPDGDIALEQGITSELNRQSQWYFRGLRRPQEGLMTGSWRGRVTVLRQHQDGSITRYEQETEIQVVD